MACCEGSRKFQSACAVERLLPGHIAQGRDDTGFQTAFGDQYVAMQTVDDIGQLALVGQLGLAELALDHDGPQGILQGYQAFPCARGVRVT